jgi:hypothetical protein
MLAAGCATTSGKSMTMLTGTQEVPPVTTAASARADISVNSFRCPSAASSENCPTVLGTVTTTGVIATAVEVRDGAPGHSGPVIARLVKVGDNTWQVPSGTILTAAQYADYWAGRLYVNVDSDAHEEGELRAQLRP